MFGYILGVKLSKFNVLHNPSSSKHYDRPRYSFRCNIESKHNTRMYSFEPILIQSCFVYWLEINLKTARI